MWQHTAAVQTVQHCQPYTFLIFILPSTSTSSEWLLFKLPNYNLSPPLTSLGRDSSVGIATTGWTVQGSNPGGGEIFRTCPDLP